MIPTLGELEPQLYQKVIEYYNIRMVVWEVPRDSHLSNTFIYKYILFIKYSTISYNLLKSAM